MYTSIREALKDVNVIKAAKNTEGVEVFDFETIKFELSRFQKLEQCGMESVRLGVFWLPEPNSPWKKWYSSDIKLYGGNEKVEIDKEFGKPIIVKASTGGKGPAKAYNTIKGKNAYEMMRSDFLTSISFSWSSINHTKRYSDVYHFLDKYNCDYNRASYIVDNSTHGNQLAYAVQEYIVREALVAAGYDSIISWSIHKGEPRFAEVFDLTQTIYPDC